jgi:hypothetical protein
VPGLRLVARTMAGSVRYGLPSPLPNELPRPFTVSAAIFANRSVPKQSAAPFASLHSSPLTGVGSNAAMQAYRTSGAGIRRLLPATVPALNDMPVPETSSSSTQAHRSFSYHLCNMLG